MLSLSELIFSIVCLQNHGKISHVTPLNSMLYKKHYISSNLGSNFINKLYIIFIIQSHVILLPCISINVHLTLVQRVCPGNYSLAIRYHLRN